MSTCAAVALTQPSVAKITVQRIAGDFQANLAGTIGVVRSSVSSFADGTAADFYLTFTL